MPDDANIHTKDEANYREGKGKQRCAYCSHYKGNGECDSVEGTISRWAACNFMSVPDNPVAKR